MSKFGNCVGLKNRRKGIVTSTPHQLNERYKIKVHAEIIFTSYNSITNVVLVRVIHKDPVEFTYHLFTGLNAEVESESDVSAITNEIGNKSFGI